MLGGSSGVNVAGAIRLARELGPGHTIVTILCDGGARYASKLFNVDFLRGLNLPTPKWLERQRALIRGLWTPSSDPLRGRLLPQAGEGDASQFVIPSFFRLREKVSLAARADASPSQPSLPGRIDVEKRIIGRVGHSTAYIRMARDEGRDLAHVLRREGLAQRVAQRHRPQRHGVMHAAAGGRDRDAGAAPRAA